MVDVSGFLPMVGGAFVDWLKLFAAPLKNLDMLWIIIPIWGVWVFSEFFQEKKGTSFGNAITNGAVMLFVGVDWIRYIMRQIGSGSASFGVESATEIGISVVIIVTSLSIIILGIKGHSFVKVIGRARESTYVLLMFTPIIYGVVEFDFRILAIILAFFPFFYVLVEILDRILPNPQTFDLDEEGKLDKSLGIGNLGAGGLQDDFSPDVFGAGRQQPQQYSYHPPQQPSQQQKGKRLF